MRARSVVPGLLLVLAAAAGASAQTIPFTLLATSNGNSSTITNDAALNFTTTVGTQAQIVVQATYTGNSTITITQPFVQDLVGSTEFSIASMATLPIMLGPGNSFTFTVTFHPVNATPAAAQLTIPFTEAGTGTGGAPNQNAIVLVLDGFSPQFTVFYVLASQNNAVPLSSGGTLPFLPTLINSAASVANLDIANTGSGEGFITDITQPPAGSPFQIQGIPLFPDPLLPTSAGGATLQLLVTYSPTAVETDTASIQITFQGGATFTVNLTGTGTTSTFTYTYLIDGVANTATPGSTITLPGANIGNSSSLIVEVKNSGNANGTINSISISNPEFALSNVPITIPTLKPGDTLPFTITFTPTQLGAQTGQLVIGHDFFNLSGQGLGPQLAYSYTSSAGTTTVPAIGGAVVFSPADLGKSEQVGFTITNSGSLPATISNIGATPANGPYTISGLPPLPLSLPPGMSVNFKITFKPTTSGYSNGALMVDSTAISLIGSGNAPPALPSYTISGPSGDVMAASQSNISLTLASPYSLDLTGTLTLSTQGTFGTDPSVQFATGSRTVDFTIPANTTSANFAGQGTELPLQTGTVAETVTLTPDFLTAGGVDVTPSSPATLQFTVLSEAPVLLSAQSIGQTSNGFELVLMGYSTTRSLGSLSVTFNPASGFNIGTSAYTADLSQVSTLWFQSTNGQAFGGQFMITIPFTLTGPTPKAGQTLLDSIASVSATVSNGVGTSNSIQTPVQ